MMRLKRWLRLLLVFVLCLCLLCGSASGSELSPPRTDGAGGVRARLDQVYEAWPAGTLTSGSFEAGGTTCFGFARMVVYRVFGKKGSSFRGWDYDGGGRTGMELIAKIETCTADNIRDMMAKARPGDVLQFDRGSASQHTMILWSVSETGVTIYENNWTQNTVTLTTMTFAEFADRQTRWSGGMRGALSLLRADNYDEIDGSWMEPEPTPAPTPEPTPAPTPAPLPEPVGTPAPQETPPVTSTPAPTAPPEPLPTPDAAVPRSVTITEDGKQAFVVGSFDGLYARVSLALDNNGESGLYIAQAEIKADGEIVLPNLELPGITVQGVNVALVPTPDDVLSSQPMTLAWDFRMLDTVS